MQVGGFQSQGTLFGGFAGVGFGEFGAEVVDDPVGHGLGVAGFLGERREIIAQGHVVFKDFGIRRRQGVFPNEALFAGEGQFHDVLADFGQPGVGGGQGHHVRLGKIAVIVGVFLGAHFLGDAGGVVPAAGGLDELAALADDFDLAGDFVFQRAAHAGKAVHVFDLDFGPEFLTAHGAHGDVDIAADHAFFHVAIADAAIEEDVLEGVEVFAGHVGAGEVGLGDDLHEGDAGAVEIHAAVAVEMEAFADILLEVRPGDADAGEAALKFKLHPAVGGGGFIVLGELVVFGGVGIEIVLAVEFGEAGDFAIEQVTGEDGFAQGFFVGHGQHAGEAQADGAHLGVGLGAIGVGAAAPHF